jgi:predicted amidohydrolase YtcJ
MGDYRMVGEGDNHLTVRAVKRFIDGALGAHGAWLLEPYSDLPSSRGLNTTDLEDLRETARLAAENGYQLCTHAIGDLGVRETLNTYESFIRGRDLRWRIEHAQHIDPVDLPRFAGLKVIAAMQTNHATSDGPWVIKRLGEKRSAEGAYVWRKLIDSGAVVCNGTDAPVENINPMLNYYSAVTRKLSDGQAFFPEQSMTRMEALRSYTINGAYAAFEENFKGSITPGKLADLTVLSDDILSVPESDIPAVKIKATIIDGQFVYRSSGQSE